MKLLARGREININRTLIMAILNITPDSFSDGGRYIESGAAISRGHEMESQGADIIDIGGESTRPGAAPVSKEDETARVVPVIYALKKSKIKCLISIDTYKSAVAREALNAGADMINDISGGTFDRDMLKTAAEYRAAFVISHILGTPGNMQDNPVYSENGAAHDIARYFRARIEAASAAGLRHENLILDPGIGFGKTLNDNFEIINNIGLFKPFGLPVLIGVSRKSMIGAVTGAPAGDRAFGTAAAVALSVEKGADIVRVHDVKEMKQAAEVAFALAGNSQGAVK